VRRRKAYGQDYLGQDRRRGNLRHGGIGAYEDYDRTRFRSPDGQRGWSTGSRRSRSRPVKDRIKPSRPYGEGRITQLYGGDNQAVYGEESNRHNRVNTHEEETAGC